MVLPFSRCGDEVHGGEGLAGDLHVVGDDVHGVEGLAGDLHLVGGEVHGGEGLVGDLHVVGDDVLDGGGLVVGGWLVPGTLAVMLAMQTRLCGLLPGSARTGRHMCLGGEYEGGTS